MRRWPGALTSLSSHRRVVAQARLVRRRFSEGGSAGAPQAPSGARRYPILRVADPGEAIAVANDTRYGLAAAVFTSRVSFIDEFSRRVQAGMIHVNHGTASQAHVPFGGVKESGQGAYSIVPSAREFFTNVKAVYVKW